MNDALTVNLNTVCDFFGVSDETVRRWVSAGCPKIKHGVYNLKAIFDWWFANINQSPAEAGDESLSEAKRKYWTAKAEVETIKVDKEREKLVTWEDIIREWTGRLAELMSGLQCLINRIPPLVEGKNRAEIRAILTDEITNLRTAYAREGKYCLEEVPRTAQRDSKETKKAT